MEDEREKYTKELINTAGDVALSTGVSGSVVGKTGEISEEEKQRKKKGRIKALVIGGIVGLVIILLGILISLLPKQEEYSEEDELFAREETKVAIFVAPMSAEVKIDGEAYLNGVYKINPGIHRVEITATGYKSRVYNYEIKADRISLLYDYLEKQNGALDENDVDVLRFIVNDDDTAWKVEEFLLEKPYDYVFASEINSPVRNIEKVADYYGGELDDYSYKVIAETLNAYFYFARSNTKNVKIEEASFQDISFEEGSYITKAGFVVVADKTDKYRISLDITRSQAKLEDAYKVWRATILTEAGTALFQYDGRYIHEEESIEEYEQYDDMIWN